MSIYSVEIYFELCCDLCMGIIHNHFDCPICETKYADTDAYHELIPSSNENYIDGDDMFSCGVCGSQFKLIDENKIELIKKGRIK